MTHQEEVSQAIAQLRAIPVEGYESLLDYIRETGCKTAVDSVHLAEGVAEGTITEEYIRSLDQPGWTPRSSELVANLLPYSPVMALSVAEAWWAK